MRSLLLPLLAYTLASAGCYYEDIQECGTNEQILIDGVTLFGIDAESDSISTLIEQNVPKEDRVVSPGQVLENLLTNNVQCGVPNDIYVGLGEIKYATYFSDDQIVVLNQNTLDALFNVYDFDDAQRVIDLYSLNAEGKYELDKEKMKARLREEESLTTGFAELRGEISDLYRLFSRVGDFLFHEFTHMTLDLEGFPHSHSNASADLLVNESGWAVRDTMEDVSYPAIDLAIEAYEEVQAERFISNQ